MDWQRRIDQLERSGRILLQLFEDVEEPELRWKPSPERWSLLEVMVHLWDEEKEDFRYRLFRTLEDPKQAWPSIDPEGWPVERRYNEADLTEALAGFSAERATSISALRALQDPDWKLSYEHPEMGTIRAGDLLAAWVAHDQLHIRQVANLRVEYLATSMAPYLIFYAHP